jgi:O-antigen/teichoic acid export membrane protein
MTSSPTLIVAPDSAPRSRFARNIVMLAASQVTTWSFSILWTVFVPRILGAGATGQMVAATAATAIVVTLIMLGTDTLLVKEIARDQRRAPQLLGSVVVLRVGLLPIAVLLLALYIQVAHFERQQVIVIWLAGAAMVFTLVQSAIQDGFTGTQRMGYVALSAVLSNVVGVPIAILVVRLGFGVIGLMTFSLALAAVNLAINAWWWRRHFPIDASVDLTRIWKLAVASMPYWLMGIFFSTYLWIDTVILSLLTPSSVVGWYGLATRLFAAMLAAATVPSMAWFPRLASAFEGGTDHFRRAVRPVFGLVLVLSLPIGAGGALIAHGLVGAVYGHGFEGAGPVLTILSLSVPITYIDILAAQVLIASNRAVVWTWVMGVALIVNPVLNVLLIPLFQGRTHNGALGAALSLLVTEAAQALVGVVALPWLFDRALLLRLLRAALATAGMSALVLLVSPIGLVAQVLVGGSSFAGLALLLRLLTAAELEGLRAAAPKIPWRRFGGAVA